MGFSMMAARTLMNVAAMVATVAALHTFFGWLSGNDSYLYWFMCLFAWRYLRFFVNLVAFWCYSPAPPPKDREPTYMPSRDVTAVIPTVDPEGAAFRGCLEACAQNEPAKIVVVTAGDELYAAALAAVKEFEERFPLTQFVVSRTQEVSKRKQVALAVPHIETDITVLLDDHVFWGPRFLQSVLYAFEDSEVGLVGTNKQVRCPNGLGLWVRIWNMLGATYLCRHNFEIRATNTVDRGVFVVSGRTCAIRTEILRHPEFLPGYTNEKFFFGLFGPLNADDDNYVTRFVVRHGWHIKIQYTDDATMETILGVEHPPATKFLAQCRRWARTTWRSNVCSLVTDRTVWRRQPYCVYAVYLTSLTNFAAIIDPLLVYLFSRSSACVSGAALGGLVSWILLTKVVKVFDHFRRHPRNIVLFPAYVAFAYFHSFLKLWALLTFWDCTWNGRKLEQIKVDRGRSKQAEKEAQADAHPHTPALRALRARIAHLCGQHSSHVRSYQQPIIDELQRLDGSFAALRREQRVMADNHETIRAALGRVVAQADDAAAGQNAALSSDDAELVEAIARVTAAVGGAENRWRGYMRRVMMGAGVGQNGEAC